MIAMWEVLRMAFQLKPDRRETDTKSLRFLVSLIEQIEYAIQGNNTSFSGFVIQACKYALANMEITERETDK